MILKINYQTEEAFKKVLELLRSKGKINGVVEKNSVTKEAEIDISISHEEVENIERAGFVIFIISG